MKKLSYLLVLFLLLGQTSCKKEKEKSVEDYLTAGTWKGDTYKITEDGHVTYQGTLGLNLSFNDNGKFKIKRSDNGDILDQGDWDLRNHDKEIFLDSDGGDDSTLYIDKLNDDRFECHQIEGNYRYDMVFKH